MRLPLALSLLIIFTPPALAQDGFRWVAEPVFEAAGSAHDGVVPLRQADLWGLMRADGQWVLPPQFEEMGGQGLGRFAAKRDGKWGMVDSSGREVMAFVHEAIGTPDVKTPVKVDGEWRLVRHDGSKDPLALDITKLTGNAGDCVVGEKGADYKVIWRGENRVTTTVSGMEKVFAPSSDSVLINTGDDWVLLYCPALALNASTPRHADARRAFGGYAAIKRNGLWGFDPVGFNNEDPIPAQFAAVRDFSEDLAPVQVASGKWGYVNRSGAMVIAPRFDAAFGHSDGIAGVRIGEKRGFIDREGRQVVAPAFADFWRHSDGIAPVKLGENWGVIAVQASDPAIVRGLPLTALSDRLSKRKSPIGLTPSTPHFYYGQDIQSRHDVQFSADGKVMLTVLTDDNHGAPGEVALWDRSSKKLVRKIKLPGLLQAQILPDSEVLAVGTNQGDLLLLDAATGDTLHSARMHDGPLGVLAVAPDGRHLASLGNGQVQVWSLPDGRPVARFRAPAEKMRFAHDSAALWFGDAFGGVWHTDLSGTETLRVKGGLFARPAWFSSGPMVSLRPDMALSPKGVLLRLTRWEKKKDGRVEDSGYRLALTTPKAKRQIDLPADVSEILSLDITPDGLKAVYSAERRDAGGAFWAVVDLRTEKQIAGEQFSTGFGWVDRLRFTPEGGLIVVGGEGGDIREVDLATSQTVATFGAPLTLAIGTVALPDSTDVYTANGTGQVLRWDMARGALAARAETGVGAGVETYFATDGRVLAVVNGYDDSDAAALSFGTLQPADKQAASGMQDRAVVDNYGKRAPVPQVIQARLQALPGQDEYLGAITLADGRFGLVTETVGEHRLYDLTTGALAVTFLASPDGEWLVLTAEGFFAASENGAKLVSVSDGLRSFSVDQVFQALYRPDLVQAKLAGDPDGVVAAAAAALDLTVVLGSGPAPRIKLTFPLPGQRAAGEVIDAGVELTDEGGGIGRVEWRVNGLTADISTRAAEALGADDTIATRLALEPGRNLIEVLAYNAAGLIASAPQSVVVDWDGSGAQTVPALHVLAVGVNDYADGRLRLTYAAADARAMGAALGKAGAGLFSSVNVVTLLDDQVTDAGLDAAFAQLAGVVQPSDVFVFFLAGHGKTVEGEYHFIPADFSFAGDDPIRRGGIAQARWQEWMAQIRARKSVLIYDTCESGSATGTRGLEAALSQSAAVERLTRATGRTILSASTDDAPALEGYRGHGVLTYALLSALQSGDANGNDTIEVTELAAFIDEKVPEFSRAAFGYRQVPQMSIKGSDFALGAQVAVLSGGPERFPSTLTHVVAGGTGVLDAPGGAALRSIDPGAFFGVFVIEERDGYARVAKDGTELGWVPVASLGRLQ